MSFAKRVLAANIGIAMFVLAATSTPARADQWSPWQNVGSQVFVSSRQVDKNIWTWRFYNAGSRTITNMTFIYQDVNGFHSDVFPGTLRPGGIFGGWAAFTASSRPAITLGTVIRQ